MELLVELTVGQCDVNNLIILISKYELPNHTMLYLFSYTDLSLFIIFSLFLFFFIRVFYSHF